MEYTDQQEPKDPLDRLEFYRAILDETPEYHPLTREAQQVWTPREVERRLGVLSADRVRAAIHDGLLPGVIPGAGNAGTMIPRSSLILHLGRLVTGWYDRQARDGEGSEGEEKAANQ